MLVIRVSKDGTKVIHSWGTACRWLVANMLRVSNRVYLTERGGTVYTFDLGVSYAYLRANEIEVQREGPDGSWLMGYDPEELQLCQPAPDVCECGAEKVRTTHSSWCPKAS